MVAIPDAYMKIQAKFQRALKTEDFSEIDVIPLNELKLAKAHLLPDRNSSYYSLLLEKIKEKESVKSEIGLKVQGVESNFAKNQDIFLAHIFLEENLIERLRKIIEQHNYHWKEGKRDDLGSISEDILTKIKDCGFFIAVMTKKDQLQSGNFTTSSWLIEEKGAALAFGHRPLIMVEEGVDRHYVGFLQSDDEMIYFNKSNFDRKIKEAINKIENTYKKQGGA
jgi:hypothetical protein